MKYGPGGKVLPWLAEKGKITAKLKGVQEELRTRMHESIVKRGKGLASVIRGSSSTTPYPETGRPLVPSGPKWRGSGTAP